MSRWPMCTPSRAVHGTRIGGYEGEHQTRAPQVPPLTEDEDIPAHELPPVTDYDLAAEIRAP
eukprot:8525534-Prorocentrum_lima.AAC.1